MGVEPTRPLGHNLLKIARLPFRHASIFLYSGESTRRSGVIDGTRTRNRQDHNLSLYQLSYDHSSVTWTRTRNRPVNSRKLCQLSYYGLTCICNLLPAGPESAIYKAEDEGLEPPRAEAQSPFQDDVSTIPPILQSKDARSAKRLSVSISTLR